MLFRSVLLIVLRAKAIDEYAKYLAFDIVAGLMPLTFIPLGWVTASSFFFLANNFHCLIKTHGFQQIFRS